MDRAAAELFLAALFVETTPERQEVLRNAAKAAGNWEGLLPALEGHGLLPLFLRNLEEAAIELPPAVASLFQARAGEQRDDHQRSRLALQRFLAAAARAGVEVTLVGGSALCFDLYPHLLRRAGDPEAYVAPEHFARALRAAEEAGLLLDDAALPAWWYRHARLPVTLRPVSPMLRGLRLSPALHHPSLCLSVREPEVVGRRRRVPFEGHPLFLLDPLDAVLELAVDISARAGEALLTTGRRHLLAAAGAGGHALRLDRLLDVRTFVERRHAEVPAAALVARAREWSAEPALRAVLECLHTGLGFLPATREWLRAVLQGLAATAGPGGAALFRPDPIERLPQWLNPSDSVLARRNGLAAGADARARHIARARHLAEALRIGVVAGLGFPLALLGRRLARGARRAAWEKAHAPHRMSEVTDAWRSAVRVEDVKPLVPRTIALPPPEEGVVRLPDHYDG